MIKKEDGRYCLYSKDGKKKLGCHDSEEKAKEQERAVQAEKKKAVEEFIDAFLEETDRDDALAFFDSDADDKGPVSRTFLNKLRELLKKVVKPDEFNAAVKQARGYAGGKHRSKKKRMAGDDEPSRADEIYMGGPRADGYVAVRLAKNDPAANFRELGGTEDEYCGRCRFWAVGACQLVEGSIESPDVCDLYRDPLRFAPPTFEGAELYQLAAVEPEEEAS